jgi:hypothetical protein
MEKIRPSSKICRDDAAGTPAMMVSQEHLVICRSASNHIYELARISLGSLADHILGGAQIPGQQ